MKQNQIYKKNLKALDKINPDLAKWLRKEKSVDWLQEIKSENNDDNLLIKFGSQDYPAYSLKNPVKEAKEAAESMNLYKEDISVLIGIGIGYLTNEILSNMEKGHKVIVIEPVADILKIALSKFDFTKYFEDRRLIIISPGGDTLENKLTFVLHFLSNESVVSAWPLTIEGYTKKRPNEYGDITKLTGDVLNQILCNTGTIAGAAGGIIADNDINCMPYVIKSRGVVELKDLYKDKPAILVSTGPSLAKNIHHLIDVQDKVIIICVGQALRPLLAYNIRPDFMATVDFGEVNFCHFKGLMDSDIPLITINRTYAPLIKAYQGPKFIAATPVPSFEHTAAGILTDKGFVESGGSVAHLVFGIAQLLGCNPITMIGQDLALGETSHIPLADASGRVLMGEDGLIRWRVADQRCHLHGENQLHGMGQAIVVPGYYGGFVTTNAGLLSFKTVFENIVKRRSKENKNNITINSTEGGTKIKGAVQLSLKEVIQKYCQKPINKSVIKPLLAYAKDGDELIEKVIPLLKQDIDNLDEILINSRKGIAVSKGIKNLMNRSQYTKLLPKNKAKLFDKLNKEAVKEAQGNRLIENQIFFGKVIAKLRKSRLKNIMVMSEKNFLFSESAHIAALKNPLVNVHIYGASRQIQTRDLKVDATINNFLRNKKDAIIRIERNIIILKAAKTAAETLKKSYKKTLKLLKKYHKTKDDSLLISSKKEPIDLDDAEDYFEAGNWAHPLLDSLKQLNIDHTSDKFDTSLKHKKAVKIYDKAIALRAEAIEKAKESEKEYHDKMTKLVEYNDLLDKAKDAGRMDKDFDKALKLIEKAVKLMPDEQEARWGLATALHHSGNIERAIKEYEKLVNDFPDNHIFRFEFGQVLLRDKQIQKGLKETGKVMEETDEYDNFLSRIGEIYQEGKMFEEAIIAYKSYLDKFPADYKIWNKLSNCLYNLEKNSEAKKAWAKAKQIKP